MIEALDIHVQGIVQGVGFRPFVYRLAKRYLVSGWVLNAADGVRIHAEAESALLDGFVMELSENAPAAAQVTQIDLREVPLQDCTTFEIRFSEEAEVAETTLVSPELATCSDCLDELFNPNDRRFRYPFVNCTNCGPRFTIIESLPYDRAATSMREFEMCRHCASEYADPADRRFHAQPDACFECGPHISWRQSTSADGVVKGACTEGTEREMAGSEGATAGADGASPGAGEAKARATSKGQADDLGEIAWGMTRAESDVIIARAVEVLRAGGIVAVKGLGGFHLACDANNPRAVARLRARKRREGKAFAVMMGSVDDVRRVCEVSAEEEAVLSGAQRSIVLLRKQTGAQLSPQLADKLCELGVMLPYTPLQHLLMHDFAEAVRAEDSGAKAALVRGGNRAEAVSTEGDEGAPAVRAESAAAVAMPPMLVMTSGNVHDEPIVTDDEEAYVKLAGIADAFLGNDRAILTRFDDSVLRVVQAGSAGHAVQMVRRARGFAPMPIDVSGIVGDTQEDKAHTVFATGPEQKNTFTLLRGSEAFVSQHIGDMENAETYDAWLETKRRFEELFGAHPQSVACDCHPEYLTSKWAHDPSQPLPVFEVQHHHAHIASVMAEQNLTGAVCGIAFDGTGYGVDGAIWGGEVMLANLQAFERFANFSYVPMPGGAAAVKHPLRMAYGALWAFDLLEHPGAKRALQRLGDMADTCDAMIERGINTPMTSSVGRLFDAASALLGVCVQPTYEGEGAILLEACMADDSWVERPCGNKASQLTPEPPAAIAQRYAVAVVKNTALATSTAQDTSVVLLDAQPTFRAMLDDYDAGVPVGDIARRFHDAIVGAIVTSAQLVQALYGIDTVALSGGVFMNRYVVEHALAALEDAGFVAAINRELPPNDGCISFGQAVVAWAQTDEKA